MDGGIGVVPWTRSVSVEGEASYTWSLARTDALDPFALLERGVALRRMVRSWQRERNQNGIDPHIDGPAVTWERREPRGRSRSLAR